MYDMFGDLSRAIWLNIKLQIALFCCCFDHVGVGRMAHLESAEFGRGDAVLLDEVSEVRTAQHRCIISSETCVLYLLLSFACLFGCDQSLSSCCGDLMANTYV